MLADLRAITCVKAFLPPVEIRVIELNKSQRFFGGRNFNTHSSTIAIGFSLMLVLLTILIILSTNSISINCDSISNIVRKRMEQVDIQPIS